MRKYYLFSITLCLAFLLLGCGSSNSSSTFGKSPLDAFKAQVQGNQYLEALDTFNNKIYGNSAAEVDATDFLKEYIKTAWQEYLDETVSRSEFEAMLQTVERIDENVNKLGWTIKEIQVDYPDVASSKAAYQTGISLLAEGDYLEAMDSFSQVSSIDQKNYADAQEKSKEASIAYESKVLISAKELVNSGSVDAAISMVYEAESVVGATDNLESFLSNTYTMQFSKALDDAFTAKDYLGTIREYLKAKDNPYVQISADMTSKYSQSIVNYSSSAKERAEEAFGENKNYENAISVVRSAISDANDISELILPLEELLEYYKSFIPVPLTSIDCIQIKRYIRVGQARADDAKDVNGNIYDPDQVIYPSGGSLNGEKSADEEDSFVTYNLNFKYSAFSAVIYRPYSSLSATKGWEENTTVKIYADDILLYEAPNFTQNTYDSIEVLLDVSGVRNLKIIMRGVLQWSSGDFGLYNYYPKVCMANVVLQK